MTAMFRYLFPLLLPIALFAAWTWYAQKRRQRTGDAAEADPVSGPLFWAIAAGFVLLAGTLVWLALSQGVEPGAGAYRSPRFEDGRIVPGRFE
jgi:hypothetical protein